MVPNATQTVEKSGLPSYPMSSYSVEQVLNRGLIGIDPLAAILLGPVSETSAFPLAGTACGRLHPTGAALPFRRLTASYSIDTPTSLLG